MTFRKAAIAQLKSLREEGYTLEIKLTASNASLLAELQRFERMFLSAEAAIEEHLAVATTEPEPVESEPEVVESEPKSEPEAEAPKAEPKAEPKAISEAPSNLGEAVQQLAVALWNLTVAVGAFLKAKALAKIDELHCATYEYLRPFWVALSVVLTAVRLSTPAVKATAELTVWSARWVWTHRKGIALNTVWFTDRALATVLCTEA